MTFLRRQTEWNTRNVSLPVASRRDRARYRLAAQALEQCEDRVLLATILGTAQNFAVLGASTVTNTGATAIVGNVGVSPGTAITGFPPGVVSGGTIHAGDAVASQAHADLVTAYGVIAGEASPPANDLTGQDLGGLTLLPGVYHFATSAALIGNTHARRPRQPERPLRFPDRYHADHWQRLRRSSDQRGSIRQRLFPGWHVSHTWYEHCVRREIFSRTRASH